MEGEAWRNEPDIGLFVIIERRFLGLVPADEPHTLARGEAARFRVMRVHPDGKVALSARGPVHQELERDATGILDVLARPGARAIGDKSPPEEIRALRPQQEGLQARRGHPVEGAPRGGRRRRPRAARARAG